MGARELERYKRLLIEKKQELETPRSEEASPLPAAGGWRGDVMDQATADTEAELQVRLRRTDGKLARAIDEALARLEKGTFGVCESCRQPIAKARLEAVPWTRLCRDCKEREHA